MITSTDMKPSSFFENSPIFRDDIVSENRSRRLR